MFSTPAVSGPLPNEKVSVMGFARISSMRFLKRFETLRSSRVHQIDAHPGVTSCQIVRMVGLGPRPPAFPRACADDGGEIFRIARRQTGIYQAIEEGGNRPVEGAELDGVG